jgi:hypothetical protein
MEKVYIMEESPDSDAQLWRFVLGRAVHEFNNRVGGILAVSDAHLSRRIENRELRESLELIRDGARAASDFVMTMADLLTVEESGPELTRLSDLQTYLRTKLTLFLPRHLDLIASSCAKDLVVRVNEKLLLFNLLALLQKELEGDQSASISIELALKVEASAGWLIYRSSNRTGPAQTDFCRALFSRMKPSLIGLDIEEATSKFKVGIGFPAVKVR